MRGNEAGEGPRRALESGDLALAEKKLSLAQSYVPTNPETNFALGNLRHAQHENPLAAQFYLATLKLDADHRGALNNLGVISLEERKYDAAETWFRRAIQVEPRNGKLHFLLAKAAFEKGEREEARSEIVTAISLNPGQDEFKRLKQRIESSSPP